MPRKKRMPVDTSTTTENATNGVAAVNSPVEESTAQQGGSAPVDAAPATDNAATDNAATDATATDNAATDTTAQKDEDAPENRADVFAGVYAASCALNLRKRPAGTILVILPKGCTVTSDGGYTMLDGTRWLHVEAEVEGERYTGFCSIRFLDRA